MAETWQVWLGAGNGAGWLVSQRDKTNPRQFKTIDVYAAGDCVMGLLGWQDHAVSDGSAVTRKVRETDLPLSLSLGVLEAPGAYGAGVVVGDGPARETLARRFPNATFLGTRRGAELASIYAAVNYDTAKLQDLVAVKAGATYSQDAIEKSVEKLIESSVRNPVRIAIGVRGGRISLRVECVASGAVGQLR